MTTYSKAGFATKIAAKTAGLWLAVFLCLPGCGAVEKSEYTEGEDPAPTTEPTTDPDPDTSDEFNTGLTPCVAEGFADSDIEPHTPITLDVTLADFADRTDTLTLAEITDVADLLFREVVATSGAIDYMALQGDYSATWGLLVSSLATVTPPTDTENAKVAYWTNAYNIMMMQFIIDKSLTDVSTDFALFKEDITVGGFTLSLDGIEKGILKLGGGAEEHPAELTVAAIEPRLHFALNCAAISCPKVRNFAYRAANLEEILNENEAMFFNSTAQIKTASGVAVSALFGWFAPDFDTLAGGSDGLSRRNMVETKILSSCRDDLTTIATAFEENAFTDLTSLDYDWTVNAQ